jgi:hypothetical protein
MGISGSNRLSRPNLVFITTTRSRTNKSCLLIVNNTKSQFVIPRYVLRSRRPSWSRAVGAPGEFLYMFFVSSNEADVTTYQVLRRQASRRSPCYQLFTKSPKLLEFVIFSRSSTMPPDPTPPRPGSKRRVPRKYTEEELKDIEIKRLKGELSCAECRRLKLKCDKKVPCSSCVRRGCESICPCGVYQFSSYQNRQLTSLL